MDTERAKNLTIIFLIILNLMLVSLLWIITPGYRITNRQESAILTLLEQNNIVLNAELIRDFRPMRSLLVASSLHEPEAIAYLLLGDLQNVQVINEFDRVFFIRDNGDSVSNLEIQDSFFHIIFGNPWNEGSSVIDNSESAITLSEQFLQTIEHLFPDFVFYTITEDEHWGDFIVEYRRVFNDRIVYSDFLRFYVDEFGIIEIDCHYVHIEGIDLTQREIRPVDEALYSLIFELHELGAFMFGDIEIAGISLVYYQSIAGAFEGAVGMAVPCYKFYVNIYGWPTITIIIDAATANVIRG